MHQLNPLRVSGFHPLLLRLCYFLEQLLVFWGFGFSQNIRLLGFASAPTPTAHFKVLGFHTRLLLFGSFREGFGLLMYSFSGFAPTDSFKVLGFPPTSFRISGLPEKLLSGFGFPLPPIPFPGLRVFGPTHSCFFQHRVLLVCRVSHPPVSVTVCGSLRGFGFRTYPLHLSSALHRLAPTHSAWAFACRTHPLL